MLGNLISSTVNLAEDVATIAVAPVQIGVDVTRLVTAPVAAVAAETAAVFKDGVDEVTSLVNSKNRK